MCYPTKCERGFCGLTAFREALVKFGVAIVTGFLIRMTSLHQHDVTFCDVDGFASQYLSMTLHLGWRNEFRRRHPLMPQVSCTPHNHNSFANSNKRSIFSIKSALYLNVHRLFICRRNTKKVCDQVWGRTRQCYHLDLINPFLRAISRWLQWQDNTDTFVSLRAQIL